MRRIVCVLAAIFTTFLLFPGHSIGTEQEFLRSEKIASTYWGHEVGKPVPECGWPSSFEMELPGLDVGLAYFGECKFAIQKLVWWPPYDLCKTVVHEWGHLTLGPTYFSATNPEEPAHSAQPGNIMFSELPQRFEPCEPRKHKHPKIRISR